MRWWEENTEFLRIENRPGKTNAYHIQWKNLEADWHQIQARIHEDASVTRALRLRQADRGVATYPTPGVATDTTGGVASDTTLNVKRNLKAETQHEMAHPAPPADAYKERSNPTSLVAS